MLVYVVLALFLSVGNCQVLTKCSDLVAKEFATPEQLLAHSPFIIQWNLLDKFNCSQLYFVKGRNDKSDVNDAIITNSENDRVTVFKMIPNAAEKAYMAISCPGHTGQEFKIKINHVKYQSKGKASYVCSTACDSDGQNFTMAFCISNSNRFKSAMNDFATTVKGIANGGSIHESQTNCKKTCPNWNFKPVN